MDITTEQIDALRTKAAAAGDLAMVAICDAALRAAGPQLRAAGLERDPARFLPDVTEREAAYAAERLAGCPSSF